MVIVFWWRTLITTVFLSVLILALAFGNAFLSLTGRKRLLSARAGLKQSDLPEGSEGIFLNGREPVFSEPRMQPGLPEAKGVSFRASADSERLAFLGKRIERLEQLLLKIDKSKFVAQKINGTDLFQRLKELEQFKQDTRLEIAALKQRLDRIRPVKERPKNPVPEISNEKLRRIVFRSTN